MWLLIQYRQMAEYYTLNRDFSVVNIYIAKIERELVSNVFIILQLIIARIEKLMNKLNECSF